MSLRLVRGPLAAHNPIARATIRPILSMHKQDLTQRDLIDGPSCLVQNPKMWNDFLKFLGLKVKEEVHFSLVLSVFLV